MIFGTNSVSHQYRADRNAYPVEVTNYPTTNGVATKGPTLSTYSAPKKTTLLR